MFELKAQYLVSHQINSKQTPTANFSISTKFKLQKISINNCFRDTKTLKSYHNMELNEEHLIYV